MDADVRRSAYIRVHLRLDLWLETGIVFDHDLSRVLFAADRQLQIVSAGLERQSEVKAAETTTTTTTTAATTAATATAAAATTKATGRTRRRIAAKVPLNSIQPHFIGAGQATDRFARVIVDRQLYVAVGGRCRFQVVTDRRAGSGIRAAEQFRTTPEAGQAGIVLPDRSRSHFKQVHIRVEHLLRDLLERTDIVEDVDATAVRTHDQIVVTRMDEDVVDAHRRHA